MFGTNDIHGRKRFNDIGDRNLMVTSAFATLQGEGPLSGQRSVFLRLALCNLACEFCDTYFNSGDTYSFENTTSMLSDRINEFYEKHDMDEHANMPEHRTWDWNLVITGGEPSLQVNMYAYMDYLINGYVVPKFRHIQIESNGILPIGDYHLDEEHVTLVVSPKCANGKTYTKPHESVLERADCLKFVVDCDIASPYFSIPQWALEWMEESNKSIYISPMNYYLKEPEAALLALRTGKDIDINVRSEEMERISFWEEGVLDKERNRKNHEHAALLCMKHGTILSLQTHLFANLP